MIDKKLYSEALDKASTAIELKNSERELPTDCNNEHLICEADIERLFNSMEKGDFIHALTVKKSILNADYPPNVKRYSKMPPIIEISSTIEKLADFNFKCIILLINSYDVEFPEWLTDMGKERSIQKRECLKEELTDFLTVVKNNEFEVQLDETKSGFVVKISW